MRTCEETVFIITRFENRVQTSDLQFRWKNFRYTSLLIGHWHLQHRCYFVQFWEQRIRRPLL